MTKPQTVDGPRPEGCGCESYPHTCHAEAQYYASQATQSVEVGDIVEADAKWLCSIADWGRVTINSERAERLLRIAATIRQLSADAIERQNGMTEALRDALTWVEAFAQVRSKDDSKVFARVNRGALRTIAEKCDAALSNLKAGGTDERE